MGPHFYLTLWIVGLYVVVGFPGCVGGGHKYFMKPVLIYVCMWRAFRC